MYEKSFWLLEKLICKCVCVAEDVGHPKKYKDVVYNMMSEKNPVFSHISLPVRG